MRIWVKSLIINMLSIVILVGGTLYLAFSGSDSNESETVQEESAVQTEAIQNDVALAEPVNNQEILSLSPEPYYKEYTDNNESETKVDNEIPDTELAKNECTKAEISEITNSERECFETKDMNVEIENPKEKLSVLSGLEAVSYLQAHQTGSDGSSGYFLSTDFEKVNVFGEERTNVLYVNTGAYYNIWGGGCRSVSYNISDVKTLEFNSYFKESEAGDAVTLNLYLDGNLYYTNDISSNNGPLHVSLEFPQGAQLLRCEVDSHIGHDLKTCFYDISIGRR